jgi:starch-binding outer membrane protein, SusD/RagB family
MKNIKYISILALSLTVFSCKDDYLDVDPIDRYGYFNFMQNESHVERAIVGGYRKFFVLANNHIWFWGDMMSDNTSFRYNPTDRGGVLQEQVEEFVAGADNSTFNGLFQESYDGIQGMNYVLQNLPKISFAVPATKELREAEARFMRAFHYFNLVRVYGDVPVTTENILQENVDVAKQYPRIPVDQVYSTAIIPDVLYAIDKLPLNSAVPTTSKGRLTKAVAQMFLAKVYMTQRKFAEAVPILQAILTQGYSLNADYASNFDPLKKNGPESIFEVQADALNAFGFGGQWTPWGTGTTIWPLNSNSRGGLNQPTADLNTAYEANDKRKAVTIGSTGTGVNTILYMRKFLNYDPLLKGNPSNFVVYRYADVLLMLAECLNEASFPNADAFRYLNQIRVRAGLPERTSANITSQGAFRLAIERERRVELAGEGHRWFDLIRTERVEAIMAPHGVAEKALKATVDRTAYSKIRILAAYPRREIQQFGYPQTPGWD